MSDPLKDVPVGTKISVRVPLQYLKRSDGVSMTHDPVLHALVDLCEALGKHPSHGIHAAYENAMNVIRERTGESARTEVVALAAFCKTWIEEEEGRALDEILAIEAKFHERGKEGFNPNYIAMCKAVQAALSPQREKS